MDGSAWMEGMQEPWKEDSSSSYMRAQTACLHSASSHIRPTLLLGSVHAGLWLPGGKNPTASFLGALRNQSLRFLNSQDPLEKIYGVRAAFEDFRPSDVCPKAHVWFLRLLNKPGLLASKRFPCGLLPCTLSSPLHEMHWVSALGSETP